MTPTGRRKRTRVWSAFGPFASPKGPMSGPRPPLSGHCPQRGDASSPPSVFFSGKQALYGPFSLIHRGGGPQTVRVFDHSDHFFAIYTRAIINHNKISSNSTNNTIHKSNPNSSSSTYYYNPNSSNKYKQTVSEIINCFMHYKPNK